MTEYEYRYEPRNENDNQPYVIYSRRFIQNNDNMEIGNEINGGFYKRNIKNKQSRSTRRNRRTRRSNISKTSRRSNRIRQI
jgi:hypothetical protein